MYIPALPKKSASVRKDESMDSASTPYARYESMDSAKGKGMNSILIKYFRHEQANFRHEEVKQIFEIAQLLLSSNDEKNIASVDLLVPKKRFIVWENSQSKSGDAPSKTDNLDKTTTDNQQIQIVYKRFVALSKARDSSNDKQPIQTVQNRLTALYQQEEEECDISKPTDHSFNTAWKLVTEASELRGKYFQKATVATDDEGGIRLRWRNLNKDREVRLYCPASATKKMYIYHEEGDSYRAEYNVSGRTLAEWLYWLSDA